MNGLADWAIANLAAFGMPILLAVSFIGSLGIPFPITLVIMAAGALTNQGILDWRLAVPACVAGAALADSSEYWLGRWAARGLERRFGKKMAWRQGLATIRRQGGWAVLLTRFWLTPLAPVINMIAGSRYPYGRFLFFDLTGQLLWVVLFGGLGFLFAAQWQRVSQAVSTFSGVSVVLIGVVAAGYIFLQWRKAGKTTPPGMNENEHDPQNEVQTDRPSKNIDGKPAHIQNINHFHPRNVKIELSQSHTLDRS